MTPGQMHLDGAPLQLLIYSHYTTPSVAPFAFSSPSIGQLPLVIPAYHSFVASYLCKN